MQWRHFNGAFFSNLSPKWVAIYKQSIKFLCLNTNTSPGVDISSCLLLNYVDPKLSIFTRTQKGAFFQRMSQISNSHLLLHCTCWQSHSLVVQCRCWKIPKQQDLLIPACLDIKWTMVAGMNHRLYLSVRELKVIN